MVKVHKGNFRKSEFGLHQCQQCSVRHRAMCAAVEFDRLDVLEQIVTHRYFTPRQMIFQEGDPADYVYNVSAGNLRLYKLMIDGRRQITGFLRPGDFLGLARADCYAYGAEAIDFVELCCMRVTDLEQLMRSMPEVRDRLLDMSRDELSAAQEQMLLLGRKSAREKVLSFLLLLASHGDGALDRHSAVVELPMTRTDMADYLGLVIESVSRTLTALKDDGLIELQATHRILIPSLDKARNAAGIDWP